MRWAGRLVVQFNRFFSVRRTTDNSTYGAYFTYNLGHQKIRYDSVQYHEKRPGGKRRVSRTPHPTPGLTSTATAYYTLLTNVSGR